MARKGISEECNKMVNGHECILLQETLRNKGTYCYYEYDTYNNNNNNNNNNDNVYFVQSTMTQIRTN